MFRRKRPKQAADINLREIAEVVLRNREARFVYREGVVDEAVRRASVAEGHEAICDAIEVAFMDYELGPRLVGYIMNAGA
jgi:hypothetical protein